MRQLVLLEYRASFTDTILLPVDGLAGTNRGEAVSYRSVALHICRASGTFAALRDVVVLLLVNILGHLVNTELVNLVILTHPQPPFYNYLLRFSGVDEPTISEVFKAVKAEAQWHRA